MFIVETVADELRDRVKKARPKLVWGLLFGKRDGAARILRVMHLANTSDQPTVSININYGLIARHLHTLQQDGCEILGYYYSCTEKTAVPTVIETLPFPGTFYALRLVSTPKQFRWEMERVDKGTGSRVQERLKTGSLQQIEQQIYKLSQANSASPADALPEQPRSLFQRLTAFAANLYPWRQSRAEPVQEQEVHEIHPTPLEEKQEGTQTPEQTRSSTIIPAHLTKPAKDYERPTHPVRKEVPHIDSTILARYQIHYLYHMTHWSNLGSILQHGLLSHNSAHRNGYVHYNIADSDVVQRRAWKRDAIHQRHINDYAPLYFNPKNPMLYVRKALQDEIVLLGFDPILLFCPETIFSDGNAASSNTKFYSHIGELERLNWQCIQGSSWSDIDDGRRIRCAEVLVYPAVSTAYLKTVFCRSHRTFQTVQQLLSKYPGIRLSLNYSLYF